MDIEELVEIAKNEVAMITQVLPEEIRDQAGQCPVSYEGKPELDDCLEEGILGLFEGASLIDEAAPDALPRIRIFLENIWEYTERDEQDFLDEVGTTFLHELGHYLGWDEDEVAEHGLE